MPTMKPWSRTLLEILHNFINVYDDQVDPWFWNQIYKSKYNHTSRKNLASLLIKFQFSYLLLSCRQKWRTFSERLGDFLLLRNGMIACSTYQDVKLYNLTNASGIGLLPEKELITGHRSRSFGSFLFSLAQRRPRHRRIRWYNQDLEDSNGGFELRRSIGEYRGPDSFLADLVNPNDSNDDFIASGAMSSQVIKIWSIRFGKVMLTIDLNEPVVSLTSSANREFMLVNGLIIYRIDAFS